MNKRYNILYVDDEISNLNVFKNTFRRNYNVLTAESAHEGLQILDKEKVDLIITDQRMPEMTGVDFLRHVMKKYPDTSRILITAYTDFDALKEAVNDARIFQYIQKPWDETEVGRIIDNALEIHQLRAKNLRLTEELKQKNEELVGLNNELLELDKLKFQFLRIISHEIRTPLNGLLGATTLFRYELKEEEFTKCEQLFSILEISAQRLAHFLELAEQITSFKAKGRNLTPYLIDNLKEIIEGTISLLKVKAIEKNISINLDLSDNSKTECYGERQLIEICLYEVLDNAIKHTPVNGKIGVKTSYCNESTSIVITDNGPGFPENVLKNIFKPFITNEDITKQGMGLDLALIKLIVEAHKGSIEIRNNQNSGANVKLVFNKFVPQTDNKQLIEKTV